MNLDTMGQLTEALNLRLAYKRIFGKQRSRISRFTFSINAAYQRLMTKESDDAERVLADLCKKADVARSVFTPGHPDKTAYDCGARDLVLGILRMVHSTDEDIRKQISELYKQ
jgi:hypothetical protein